MPTVVFETIRQLYERGMRILVASSPVDGEIMGFVAFEAGSEPVLHFLYVRPDYRGHGVSHELLGEAGMLDADSYLFTHKTRDSWKLPGSPRFVPEIARRKHR